MSYSLLVQHLIESSWFAVLETLILLAAFHQEMNITFVGMVSVLFVMKSFHWLTGDRVDYVRFRAMCVSVCVRECECVCGV